MSIPRHFGNIDNLTIHDPSVLPEPKVATAQEAGISPDVKLLCVASWMHHAGKLEAEKHYRVTFSKPDGSSSNHGAAKLLLSTDGMLLFEL